MPYREEADPGDQEDQDVVADALDRAIAEVSAAIAMTDPPEDNGREMVRTALRGIIDLTALLSALYVRDVDNENVPDSEFMQMASKATEHLEQMLCAVAS